MESKDKIVDFTYCNHCKFKDYPEEALPCHECLNEPVNTDSQRPLRFEPTEEWVRKDKCQRERARLAHKSRIKNVNLNKAK